MKVDLPSKESATSEHKIVIVKKVYFDFGTTCWTIVLLYIGLLSIIRASLQVIEGAYIYLIVVIFGLFVTLLGCYLLKILLSKRDKKILVRKTDDEILDELIVQEEFEKENKRGQFALKEVQKTAMSSSQEKKRKVVNNFIFKLDKTKSIYDVVNELEVSKIVYSDLLTCYEWQYKRLKILLRDDFRCKMCNNRSTSNHVHHTYYLQDRFPWENDESSLETLCPGCHKQSHIINDILIKAVGINGSLTTIHKLDFNCYKCGGSGYIPVYSHIEGGVCFNCRGHEARNNTFRKPLREISCGMVYNHEFERLAYRNYFLDLSQDDLQKLLDFY